jgi:inosine-uridine nucleoside N-ribohydrolase
MQFTDRFTTCTASWGEEMKKVILDCDPGHDDMMAIILACASEELDVLGITTVAGNQTGEKTFNNAMKVLSLIGENQIPVIRGFDKPMLRDLTIAPNIHGNSGLDGAELPPSTITPSHDHAVDFMSETMEKTAEKISIIATGPLTNIAVTLIKAPEIKHKIERIIIMGGALYDSNITPAAEFNFYVDPEAAKYVIDSGLPITLVTLDVSNKALFTWKDIEELKSWDGRVSSIIGSLLQFFGQTCKDAFDLEGAPLHDPITVSYAIDPDILLTRHLHVDVETISELTRGRTVADVYGVTGKRPNVDVSFKLDNEKFKALIFDAIKKYDA